MSSHHPRSGSASATPAPTPSPQPPPSEESSSQPSTSSRSRAAHSSQSHSRRSHQLGRHRATPLAEEQPGLEVYYPQSSSAPPAAASPDARVGRTRTRVAPSFWSKEVADNPSQFTFYRDPTPTPPEKREREKAGDYVGSPLPQRPGRSSTVALETALTIPPPDTRRRPPRNDTICGLGRRMFFLAVAAVVLLVLGIAVGVGVGVGAGKKSIQSSQPAAASSSSSTPTTTATSPTSSTTQISSPSSSTTGSSASPIPTAVTDCPFINNTIYQVPGSSKSFLRLCGIDYSGDSEAVELDHKPTLTFADCMGNCAGTYGCVGCSWGIDPEDPAADHQCWMKGELKAGGHTVASDRCFAILQQ